MKAVCVVLNYNDAETTERLVQRIRSYSCFSHIVIVDNASTDNSWERLLMLQDHKVCVIRAGENGGYGAGNNLGVRYAVEKYDASHVLLCNPDVRFSEDCVERMMGIFRRHSDVGVATVRMKDAVYGDIKNGWPLRCFSGELLAMGPVSRRVFYSLINYPDSYFNGKKGVYVDVVHGSMLMVDTKAFRKCKGYDEGIFLYQEEAVLGQRMKSAGYRTVLILDQEYQHEHGASIGRSVKSAVDRQRLREDSVMFYFRKYLHVGRLRRWVARVWFWGIQAETVLGEAGSRLWTGFPSVRRFRIQNPVRSWLSLPLHKRLATFFLTVQKFM